MTAHVDCVDVEAATAAEPMGTTPTTTTTTRPPRRRPVAEKRNLNTSLLVATLVTLLSLARDADMVPTSSPLTVTLGATLPTWLAWRTPAWLTSLVAVVLALATALVFLSVGFNLVLASARTKQLQLPTTTTTTTPHKTTFDEESRCSCTM